MRSGFAELIKHGLISDGGLFDLLRENFSKQAALSGEALPEFLAKGIKVKADIVAQDETEQGVRAFLNFGHTFGHALEAFGGFKRFLHGEAIIFGMIYALILSEREMGLKFDLASFSAWLSDLGYETTLPDDVTFEEIYSRMLHDKKNDFRRSKIRSSQ